MKIANIKIENLLGAVLVDVPTRAPIQLFSGHNHAGKSSTRDGVVLAMTADLGRVSVKKDAPQLIHSAAASESADRLTMTAARAYAHHTDGAELLMALERDAQRMAARCASARYAPMAEVVAGFMTALLRLMADLQPPRDSSLSYAEVFSAELGPVRVGFDASGVREVWTTRPTNVLSSMCNGDVDDLLVAARGLQ